MLLAGCDGPPAPSEVRGPAPTPELPAPVLKRLTATQYARSVGDLLGDGLVLPRSLEPDQTLGGLLGVGGSVATVSPLGVEQYESAAYDLAEQVMGDADRRDALVGCSPAAVRDDACAAAFVTAFGRRAWRRPLTDDEVAGLVAVAGLAAETVGDFHAGLGYAIAGLLQSPYFLYRVEVGEPDPDDPDGRRYTDWEMASRLSYFFWNTTPDEELLAAAEAGELTTDAGLDAQVDRLLADPRAREGVRNLFDEMFRLYGLEDLNKDPTVFVHMGDTVGPSAREETLLGVEHLVFDLDGDYRTLFTTRTTFLDRKLAAIYAVPAPAREGFAMTELPADGPRRGLLGQVSFLALQAHPANTSVTRRGLFVREVLLCQDMPAPPADADTSIPEASADAPTMRDRVAEHLENPSCASCHQYTDPIGLGLENFDGLGSWRDTDGGMAIDATGELDGMPFVDPWTLSDALARHPELGPCLARTVYQYGTGQVAEAGVEPLVEWHADGFVLDGHRVLSLLAEVARSPSFRRAGAFE